MNNEHPEPSFERRQCFGTTMRICFFMCSLACPTIPCKVKAERVWWVSSIFCF